MTVDKSKVNATALKPRMQEGKPSSQVTTMHVYSDGHEMGSQRKPKGAELMKQNKGTK